jgi:hypothetical protein
MVAPYTSMAWSPHAITIAAAPTLAILEWLPLPLTPLLWYMMKSENHLLWACSWPSYLISWPSIIPSLWPLLELYILGPNTPVTVGQFLTVLAPLIFCRGGFCRHFAMESTIAYCQTMYFAEVCLAPIGGILLLLLRHSNRAFWSLARPSFHLLYCLSKCSHCSCKVDLRVSLLTSLTLQLTHMSLGGYSIHRVSWSNFEDDPSKYHWWASLFTPSEDAPGSCHGSCSWSRLLCLDFFCGSQAINASTFYVAVLVGWFCPNLINKILMPLQTCFVNQ